MTVNENSGEPPVAEADSINSPARLAEEATRINQAFSQQILEAVCARSHTRSHAHSLSPHWRAPQDAKGVEFERPNPFIQDQAPSAVASLAFRYRKWKVDDVTVVVRTEVNAVQPAKGDEKPVYIAARALNEYDPRIQGTQSWRTTIVTQVRVWMAG